jgi:hypothetical protein
MKYECNRRGFLKYSAGLAGVMAANSIYPLQGTLAHVKETDIAVIEGIESIARAVAERIL